MHHLLLKELESSKQYKESSKVCRVGHNQIAKHIKKTPSQHGFLDCLLGFHKKFDDLLFLKSN